MRGSCNSISGNEDAVCQTYIPYVNDTGAEQLGYSMRGRLGRQLRDDAT